MRSCCNRSGAVWASWSGVRGCLSASALLAAATASNAGMLPFSTTLSSQYQLIGMGPANSFGGQPGVGTAVHVSNFEIGANKAPVPSTSGFLGGSGGPHLLGAVPNIPLNAAVVASGICGGGNIAVTNPQGRYVLQNTGVYGTLGVHAQASIVFANDGTQNSFFNDPNHFPNTFTSTGFTNPGVNKNTGGFGTLVGPGAAVQSTRMDANNFAGVTGNVDLSGVRGELAAARSAINALASTMMINVPGGVINSHTTITLGVGLNVIDFNTGGNDLKLENSNLVIDGPAGAKAIFRVPNTSNFLVSNANILAGDGGLGLDSILFYTERQNNNQHFNFNNTIINGVAFWSLGLAGGEIKINNAQGCTQLVADKVNLNDVRFCNCNFVIPAPGAAVAMAMAGLVMARRRR